MVILIDTEKELIDMHSQKSDSYIDEVDFIGTMATVLSVAVSTFPLKYFDRKEEQYKFVDVVNTIAKQMIDEDHKESSEGSENHNNSDYSDFEDSDDKYKEI